MSYLDLPRIQFGGLFFTNPDTINNYIRSYDPETKLVGPDGKYLSEPPDGGPGGWSPLGVAQLWVEEARVLSAVGPDGKAVASDPIVGASVESPSPSTPKAKPGGTGSYDFAKMVDLDPYMQSRSAVYGLRLFVTLPGGGGFGGLLTVPELQYLGGRVAVRTGSWAAVGTWTGFLEELDWFGDIGSSAFLGDFRSACADGVAVKLTVDLHQNDPATRSTVGNQFMYGRVQGAMGPVRAGDLPQVWPGRRLAAVSTAGGAELVAEAPATAATSGAGAGEAAALARTIDDEVREHLGGNVAAPFESFAAEAPGRQLLPWNPVPARVSETDGGSFLHADLGGSIFLDFTHSDGIFDSNGRFVVDSGIELGALDDGGDFVPFAAGAVDFSDQYRTLESPKKTVDLVASSGIVDVALTPEEAELVASRPLAIRVGSTPVVEEPGDGILMELSHHSARLDQGGEATFQLVARKLGQPLGDEELPKITVQPVGPGGEASDLVFEWQGSPDAQGLVTGKVTATDRELTLPAARKPLDSLVYLVTFDGPNGPIGDSAFRSGKDALAVLLFNAFDVPAEPEWSDVGPILEAYARLYPGMKDILDIGDEETVKRFAAALYHRMAAPFADPGFMPVTRDLSPAKTKMVLDWLRPHLATGSPS